MTVADCPCSDHERGAQSFGRGTLPLGLMLVPLEARADRLQHHNRKGDSASRLCGILPYGRLMWPCKLIWERVLAQPTDTQRRLVAIFAADVEGYSRLMGNDDVGTLRALSEKRIILDALISSHQGR